MGYEYDSKVNRDLARTAMSIYTNSHNIKPLNESAEFINEEALRENVNALILNYVSDVIVLAESHLGREMTDTEINESSMEVLNRIDSISPNEKAEFVQQLAEAAGPALTQADSMGYAPSSQGTAVSGRNGMGVVGKPQGRRPSVSGRRPTSGSGNQLGQGPGSPGSVAPGRPSGPNVSDPDPIPNQLGQGPGSPGSVAPGRPSGNQLGQATGSPGTQAPNRPTGGLGLGQATGSPGTQAPGRPVSGDFDPSNYASIQDYIDNGFNLYGGAGLSQMLAYFQNQGGPSIGVGRG